MKLLSKIGDFLNMIGLQFPMTSFRLNNMMTDNIIDLKNIHNIIEKNLFTTKEGIVETINWIEQK